MFELDTKLHYLASVVYFRNAISGLGFVPGQQNPRLGLSMRALRRLPTIELFKLSCEAEALYDGLYLGLLEERDAKVL